MAAKHIAFRTDATGQIGTGHFMRCLTLADALQKKGVQILFVSRDLSHHFQDMLVAKGIQFASLKNYKHSISTGDLAHEHWLGASQEQDAQDTISALSDQTWDWLIVDHYALDARWEGAMRTIAKQIMVIDDIADRQHDCDILLDQNFYTDMEMRYSDKVPAHCQLLLGPRYALLRDEFRKLHERVKPRTGPVKRILIFFGGVDADNYTGRAINALAAMGAKDLLVDVVIGTQHPSRTEIEAECAAQGFSCHVQTNHMAELMAAADLAIGAGGSATWERCCLGLPALSICVAYNQQRQITDAAQKGLLYAPAVNKDWVLLMKTHAAAMIENPNLRRFISENAMQTVDGWGVQRIVSNLGVSGIAMRNVKEEDSAKLFEWRNHPNIRSVSRNSEPISWENHQKWFSAILSSQDRVVLIGQNDGVPVGVVRFDSQEDCAEVSIYLVPDSNHFGQGRSLLLSAEQWLIANRSNIHSIRAYVIGGNLPSQRLFLGAGYRVESTSYLKKLN